MGYIKVEGEVCKGCGLCVAVCPKKILEVSTEHTNSNGYGISTCVDDNRCIGCAFCAKMCPEVAIEVFK